MHKVMCIVFTRIPNLSYHLHESQVYWLHGGRSGCHAYSSYYLPIHHVMTEREKTIQFTQEQTVEQRKLEMQKLVEYYQTRGYCVAGSLTKEGYPDIDDFHRDNIRFADGFRLQFWPL